MDSDVVGQLGSFALGQVLADLNLDSSVIDHASNAIGTTKLGFSKESIYNNQFEDDGDQDQDGEEGDDLESMVDKEMNDEKYGLVKNSTKTLMRGEEDDFDDFDDDLDEDRDPDEIVVKEEEIMEPFSIKEVNKIELPPLAQINLKELFPQFEPNKVLAFTDLFTTRPRKRIKKSFDSIQLNLPTPEEHPKARSSRDILVAPLRLNPKSKRLQNLVIDVEDGIAEGVYSESEEEEDLLHLVNKNSNPTTLVKTKNAFELAELDDWEDKIIWGPSEIPYELPKPNLSTYLAPRNEAFEKGSWLKSIIWDEKEKYNANFTKLNLNLNDTEMLLELDTDGFDLPILQAAPIREIGLDPYNLSNDRAYEVAKETKERIRQTFGLLEVQHAYPAQKLQLPFYKTRLTKSDARSFHRPGISFMSGIQFNFTKVRNFKKKVDKVTGRKIKKSDGILRTMSDVSLRENCNYVLWEYSEESPPIISNIGMGSILVNYYRKKDTKDEFIPKLDVGEPFLLEPSDESPFKTFGSVQPGETVSALYNNLVRAPLFRQRHYETDFLLIRSTINGESKYFIRPIKINFIVGQTYPLNEVPGPHSRKVTTLVKNRLQSITFKLVNKNKGRIKVSKLTKYFPDQSDLQMRQRLKEFMEFNRKEPNNGYWTVKKHIPIPDANELLKLSTPEMVCLAESMQVGLRHLQDAGYGEQTADVTNNEDETKLDIEQQLAPWITTKNFINATANKAMLKLYGDGDPTGRGEAFSFLRVSMKDIFLRDGEQMEERLATMKNQPKSAHRYNVQEQQDVYKEEIARIWKLQSDSLSNPIEPILTQEDEDLIKGKKRSNNRSESKIPGETPGGTPSARGNAGNASGSEDDNASVGSGRGDRTKILRIRRLIKGVWVEEIVRDPGIIRAYVRQRQLIEEDKIDADQLMPSDDAAKNDVRKRRLKEQVEKLKKNQERRLNRKNAKLGIQAGAMGVGGKRAVKTETTRVCGNCGQRGHMKTSRKLCPRFAEFNQPRSTEISSALPSALAAGGLALPVIGNTVEKVKPSLKLKVKLGGGSSAPATPAPASGI